MPSSTTIHTYKGALKVAELAHSGQIRASGEPYIEHPKAVAELLKTTLDADMETIIAALMHDTVEDTSMNQKKLQEIFGTPVSKLVEGVTKVGKVEKDLSSSERNMHSIRKMFRAMGSDMRVIFIKLADRLHNMQTLSVLPPEKQIRIARETQDIYCPLADIVGIRPWLETLSDLCLKILDPTEYSLIERKRTRASQQQLKYLQRWVSRMRTFLKEMGFGIVGIYLEPRHSNGVKRAAQGQLSVLDTVETFFRVKVITKKEEHCYQVMGYLHQFAVLLPNRISDYIAQPKTNGYQALHTTLLSSNGIPIKIIIQTSGMEKKSKYGSALPYTLRPRSVKAFQKTPPWMQMLLSLESNTEDTSNFFRTIQSEIFGDRCHVHLIGNTKKITDTPVRSSVLDLAYHTSPESGNFLKGANINNKPVPINHIVKDGDFAELIFDKRKLQRTPIDMLISHTSLAQKFLNEALAKQTVKKQKKMGGELISQMFDILIDPFFSAWWRKALWNRLEDYEKKIAVVGNGTINPFDYIQECFDPLDFFLVDPKCFVFSSQISPNPKIKFILRTSINELRKGNIIGVHSRPDVIDVFSTNEQRADTPSRELVSLGIKKNLVMQYPFRLALKWLFKPESNPLNMITTIQSIVETPIELLEFDGNSATIGVHTASIQSVRLIFEYLYADENVTSIVRTSP